MNTAGASLVRTRSMSFRASNVAARPRKMSCPLNARAGSKTPVFTGSGFGGFEGTGLFCFASAARRASTIACVCGWRQPASAFAAALTSSSL